MSLKLNKCLILIFMVLVTLLLIPISFASDVSDDGAVIGSADDVILATSVDDESDIVSASADTSDVLSVSGDIYVNKSSTSDTEDGSQQNPYKTIGGAITNSEDGSTIYIAAGTYEEYGFSLTKSVSIIGSGMDDVIIDAGGNGRIFDITTNNVNANIKNLTLANGLLTATSANQGAAIRIYLATVQNSIIELHLDSVRFVNNTARGAGGAIYNDGGYTTSRNNILEINNCEFINCSSSNTNAGAIQTQSSTTITNSLFSGCRAAGSSVQGGAIMIASTKAANTITISNCTFENNTVAKGVIYTSTSTIGDFNIINNAFVDEGYVIFASSAANGEKITSIENNWWGTNNPDFSASLSNVATPKVFAQLDLSAEPTEIETGSISTITTKFVWNGTTTDATVSLPKRFVK